MTTKKEKDLVEEMIERKVRALIFRIVFLCRGMTTRKLAKKLGVSQGYISQLIQIHGKKRNKKILKKIAKILSIPEESGYINIYELDLNKLVKEYEENLRKKFKKRE